MFYHIKNVIELIKDIQME